MRCAVFGCNNNNDNGNHNFSYHSFPKNKNILKKWLCFCRRKDEFLIENARICSVHFSADDFSNSMQFQMGFSKLHLLKTGAVPSVVPQKPTVSSRRTERMAAKKNKDLVLSLLKESSEPESASEAVAENEVLVETETPEQNIFTAEQYYALKNEVTQLKQELFRANEKEKVHLSLILKIQAELMKANAENAIMRTRLAGIFTKGQVKKLCNDFKRQTWTEEDIAQSIALYSAGARTYRLLRRKQFPLPGIRTLQTWAQKVDISPGILKPVIKILGAVDLTEAQKVCVLSFDEMKIKRAYCYDKVADKILPPVNNVQVVMLRGLVSKWKQPIFYNFDCKMTTAILYQILDECRKCGYNVVAIVSDLGGGNRGIYKDLNVDMNNPWFIYDDNKVFVFADVPHLIKLLRNHFIDTGYIIEGKVVKKDIIIDLLSSTSSHLRITHKISEKHLNVVGAERQKVKTATKLFSHTIAQAITRAASLGHLQDHNWEACAKLFKLANDWFDVMNVRAPTEGSRERMHAYGLALDVQNKILDDMTELTFNMRAVHTSGLLPFQKGIIQSCNALKMLLTNVKERFNLEYILTYRLNQDVLENFFGVLRAKGGLHDHPNQMEFTYRLRSYILGHNEGALSNEANVSIDDTPDLEGSYPTLTGHVFRSTSNNTRAEVIEEDLHDDALQYDGLENLAGYICHRFRHEMPGLHVSKDANNTFTWVDHLSEGNLTKPTEGMMQIMLELNKIFEHLNGTTLWTLDKYLDKHLELAEHINCDKKVKIVCFRSMMYFRIRTLNREILDTKSRKRKFDKVIK